jgi:GGDEF domain-containing protein
VRCFLATSSSATFTCWSGKFVVLLSGVDVASARSVPERVRASVAAPDDDGPSIAASAGMTPRTRREGFEHSAERAYKAVYLTRASGRKQVGVAD